MARVKHKRAIWHGKEVPLCEKFKDRYTALKPSFVDNMDLVSCKVCREAYRAGVPQKIGTDKEVAPERKWWDD